MLKDLTYKVVVMDDDSDLYDDYADYIREYLSAEGYLLETERYEELEALDEIDLDSVDLFLVDLKYGKEDKGPEFIKKIREDTLTDILFYSSDSKAIQANRDSGEYEGLYFAVRDENTKEIQIALHKLLHKMIKRSNTPLSSRGIVLGCVAELDNVIKSKIMQISASFPEGEPKELIDECVKLFHSSFRGRANKIYDFFECQFHEGITPWGDVKEKYKCSSLYELASNPAITDSSKNFQLLMNMYKKMHGEDETLKSIKPFKELLDVRNVFAHVSEEKNGEGLYQLKCLKSNEYLVLSEEKCRDLRKELIAYSQRFGSLGE